MNVWKSLTGHFDFTEMDWIQFAPVSEVAEKSIHITPLMLMRYLAEVRLHKDFKRLDLMFKHPEITLTRIWAMNDEDLTEADVKLNAELALCTVEMSTIPGNWVSLTGYLNQEHMSAIETLSVPELAQVAFTAGPLHTLRVMAELYARSDPRFEQFVMHDLIADFWLDYDYQYSSTARDQSYAEFFSSIVPL